jgi:hypothetical protein
MLTLTSRQKEALKLLAQPNSRNVCLFGGSRSGKTILFLYALIVRAMKCQGSHHLIVREIHRDVKQKIGLGSMPNLLGMLGLKASYDKGDARFVFPGGSEIWLAGLDESGSRDQRILGSEWSTILGEEASEIAYESTVIARTRLSEKNDLAKRFWFSCNPPSRLHWLYQLFIEHNDPTDRRPLVDPEHYVSLRMNPVDNLINLDRDYLSSLDSLPARQRIRFRDGEWGNPNEGVLWRTEWLENNRIARITEDLDEVVVGVDPACGGACETGIVAAGLGQSKHIYIIADRSSRGTPAEWALAVVSLAKEVGASRIVAESNQGGEMVRSVLQASNPALQVELVHAGASKRVRAEPVAALAERGMVHHVGHFLELEDQLLSWAPGSDSPDRLDAMVHACAALLQQQGSATPRVAGRTDNLGLDDEALWETL